jgi:ATP-dependent phosphoenolpyruvate carboxykinase
MVSQPKIDHSYQILILFIDEHKNEEGVFTGKGILTEASGEYAGMDSETATKAIVARAEKEAFGRWKTQVNRYAICSRYRLIVLLVSY